MFVVQWCESSSDFLSEHIADHDCYSHYLFTIWRCETLSYMTFMMSYADI